VPPYEYTVDEYVNKFPSDVLYLIKILRARMDKILAKKKMKK